MKCVCGYEGKDFLFLSFLMGEPLIIERPKTVALTNKIIICPKCGTLKIEVKK